MAAGEQQADQSRERNRQHDGEGGARAAEKDQDHDASEHQADARFFDQILDGELDEDRLIENDGGLSDAGISTRCLMACFMPSTMVMVLLLPPCLKIGHVDRALAVDAHDVVLQSAGVFGVADIGNQHGGVADGLERHLSSSTFASGNWLLA